MPRPLFVQAGAQDDGSPLPLVREAFRTAEQAAAILASPPPKLEIHEGGHGWSDAEVWDWLANF